MGLAPRTFEIEVQQADQLRHEGTDPVSDSVVKKVVYSKFYCILK